MPQWRSKRRLDRSTQMRSPTRRGVVEGLTRKRARGAIVALLVLSVPATCTYKYGVADEPDRRCGITNLFKWDYSAELAEGVRFSADESDVRVDFTRLKNWKRVCLMSMYEEELNGPVRERPWEGLGYYELGRWQCSAGNPVDAVTVALIKRDGGTLARQLKFPERIKSRIVTTNYEGSPGMEVLLAAGFRQCAEIESAVARCARIEPGKPRGCYLFFPPEKPNE
jgi:hypothetical protein